MGTKSESSLQDFSENITVHGLPKILTSHSKSVKFTWIVLFSGAAVLFVVQSVSLLSNYFSNPTKTTLSYETLHEFPSVTLCNLRHIDPVLNLVLTKTSAGKMPKGCRSTREANKTKDEMYLCYLGKKYKKELKAYETLKTAYQNIDKIKNNYAKRKQIFDLLNKKYPWMSSAVYANLESRVTFAANYWKLKSKVPEEFGIEFEHFLINCNFGEIGCTDITAFRPIYTPFSYNCYTFHTRHFLENVVNDRKRVAVSLYKGLDIVLLADGMYLPEEYSPLLGLRESLFGPPISNGVGIRVIIHPSTRSPIPFTQAWEVQPGKMTWISVRAEKNVKANPPYGPECTLHCPFTGAYLSDAYNYMGCKDLCKWTIIRQQCNCSDMVVKDFSRDNQPIIEEHMCREFPDGLFKTTNGDQIKYLSEWADYVACALNVSATVETQDYNTKDFHCPCQPNCEETTYKTEVSSLEWPEPVSITDQDFEFEKLVTNSDVRFLLETIAPNTSTASIRQRLRHLTRINIFLSDCQATVTTEKPQMSAADLASSLGGALGLWMGVSVLSMCEIVELVCKLIRSCKKTHRQITVKEAENIIYNLPPKY